jgi:hypothetical protein
MASLPIQTTASQESEWISKFYVHLFSLAATANPALPIKEQLFQLAEQAKSELPPSSYPAAMYRYVKGLYASGIPWEQARDSVYQRYQVEQLDGYDLSGRNLYCNACYAAGINFAASLVSLFYGEGDLKETIKIGALAGWDSDNPTATWGGLIGLMLGKEGVEKAFGRKFSNKFHIHRTRQGFPNEGIDTFEAMTQKGLWIIDRVVQEELKGGVDLNSNSWYIPKK